MSTRRRAGGRSPGPPSSSERSVRPTERPDDIAEDDIATWRATWAGLATLRDRWIELRILALETAAALDRGSIGVDLGAALRDPDPEFRRAAVSIVPLPAPVTLRAALAGAVIHDIDPQVALGAAQSLCLSLDSAASPAPILDALGPAGIARIRALAASDRAHAVAAVRDAERCLAADRSP